jgi:Protein of unknown function (DUF3105)
MSNTTNSNRTPTLIGAAVVVIAVVVIGLILSLNRAQPPLRAELDITLADSAVQYGDLGQQHLAPSDPLPTYNSNPPTSGPHHPSPAPAGVYTEALPDINLVHNLEHGHIWFSYRDAGDTEAIEALRQIQALFPRMVIVTHRPENDTRIGAAAWRWLLTVEEINPQQLINFVLQHGDRAPESVPG